MMDIVKTTPGEGATLARVLIMTTAVQIMATGSALSITAMAPLISQEVAIDVHLVGYQVSLVYLAGIVASAFAGHGIRHLGAGRVEAMCLIWFSGGLVMFSFGSVLSFAIGAVFIGLGYGLQNAAASDLLRQATPDRARNMVFSVKQSGVPLGALVASLSFPLLAEAIGWQGALMVFATVSFALSVLVYRTQRAPERHLKQRGSYSGFLHGQKLLASNRTLKCLALLSLVYSVVQLSFSTFIVTALMEEGGWTLIAAGTAAAVMHGCGAFSRIGWGYLADRLGGGMRILGLIGLLGTIVSMALAAALSGAANPYLIIPLLVGTGIFWMGWNGVMLAEVARNAPAGAVGETTGALLIHTYSGVLIGPSGFALLTGLTDRFSVAFAFCSVCGIIGFLATRYARQP